MTGITKQDSLFQQKNSYQFFSQEKENTVDINLEIEDKKIKNKKFLKTLGVIFDT